MARPQKVSDDQILNAILQARADGKSLSVREIQARVGGGDMKRISQALDRFKKDNGLVPLATGSNFKDESLNDQETKRAIESYKAMKQAVRQSLMPEQEMMRAELQEAIQVRDDALNENERLKELLEISENQKADLYEQLRDALVKLGVVSDALEKAEEKSTKQEEAKTEAENGSKSTEIQQDEYLSQLNELREEVKRLKEQVEEDRRTFLTLDKRNNRPDTFDSELDSMAPPSGITRTAINGGNGAGKPHVS